MAARRKNRTPATKPQFRGPGISAGLTIDDVIESAIAHIEKDGVDTLTMRRLATRLEVTPMTIYRHVANKHELLSLVADRYLDALPEPSDASDWERYLLEWFASLHELMLEQPVLAHVIVRQPLDGPIGWKLADHVLGVLNENGFELRQAGELFTDLLTFTIGFSLVRLGRPPESDPLLEDPDDERRAAYPYLAEAMQFYTAWLDEDSFKRGLQNFIKAWPAP